MKLIDADKLMESLNPKESVWVGLVLSELIANAPTVEAIPVEWIVNWLNKSNRHYCDTDQMLLDWEKENESN